MHPLIWLTTLRLVSPFIVYINPLLGSFVAVVVDGMDWEVLRPPVVVGDDFYQRWDKVMDMYLLFIFTLSMLKNWKNKLALGVALFALFVRVVGVFIFELTLFTPTLFLFPNFLFEYFIFMELYKAVTGKYIKLSFEKGDGVLVLSLLIFKYIQEYMVHVVNFYPWEWKVGAFFQGSEVLSRYLNIASWVGIFIVIQMTTMVFLLKKRS